MIAYLEWVRPIPLLVGQVRLQNLVLLVLHVFVFFVSKYTNVLEFGSCFDLSSMGPNMILPDNLN